MPKPIELKIIENSRLYVKYSNGISGEISLDNLLNNDLYPEFKKKYYLDRVSIDPTSYDPVWPNGASLCKNAIYKQLELKNMMDNFGIDLNKI